MLLLDLLNSEIKLSTQRTRQKEAVLFTNVLAVCPQGVVTDASPQTVAPSSQEVTGQQQIQVDNTADHISAYSYQSK